MAARKSFVACVHNEGYQSSLELRKIYETLADADAAKNGQICGASRLRPRMIRLRYATTRQAVAGGRDAASFDSRLRRGRT